MNKECLENLVKNVDAQLFEIVNNLICSICQELFNKPVTTPCGHSFCNGCIKRVLSSKNNSGCPLCKNPVKRYGLKEAQVKLTFSDICKELPLAFKQDVKDLTVGMLEFGEDLANSSKLSQFYNQELVKELKTSKQKPAATKTARKITNAVQSENESESSCLVLKRETHVQEYASAKKRRMEELVSVSQTEPTSHSSLCESFEMKKKLEKIEKIPPEEKINEWFNAVGDNIFINSPGFSVLETDSKNGSDAEQKECKSTTIGKENSTSGVCCISEIDTVKIVKDPYEFIPSQNKKVLKKKRQKRLSDKKIPHFKALQRFSKESLKRNTMLLNASKEEVYHEEEKNEPSEQNQTTASQKFEELLLETKEVKKCHTLYSASQSSSLKFLDVSFKSKSNSPKKPPKGRKKFLGEEEILFKDIELSGGKRQKRNTQRPKRKRSLDAVKSEKKQKLPPQTKGDDETSHSIFSIERCLASESEKTYLPPTKLGELLKELVDDDIIYATRPANAPVRLPEIIQNSQNREPYFTVTQNTELIGFCTQQECPNEKNFKRVVNNMEKELNLIENLIENPKQGNGCQIASGDPQTIDPLVSAIENDSCKLDIEKTSCVEFLHLGKLTPIRKRAKSTVVKVVFPIGLSSLARRHVLQTSFKSPVQTQRKQTRQVSTGIQTSEEESVSCLVQTSQVLQSSTAIQTSQEVRPSVEIQTTQKWNTSTEVQTSQRLICQEIQTTQIEYDSAQVQTSQLPSAPQTITLQSNQTPLRKPSHQHRKIVKRKSLNDSSSLFPFTAADKHFSPEKEVIMDFDLEEEFDRTWKKTQKHDQIVEIKNQKNLEQNEKLSISNRKSVDLDSDDSDILPPRRRNSARILSHDSVGILEEYETRQKIPLDVRRGSPEIEMEVIQLDTPQTVNSEEQMMRVLKNIDLDMPKAQNLPKGEKSEESDSDFFVEQTPPRSSSRVAEDTRNLSVTRNSGNFKQSQIPRDSAKNDNLVGVDIIGDSLPKGFTDSFLTPKKMSVTPEKNSRDEVHKLNLKIQPTIDLPNENDQNQMNAFEDKKLRETETKAFQLKAIVDMWKRPEASFPVKVATQKKLCILASSVTNPDLIKKFTSKFKAEYLNKPTKDMTHLIVGLHENDDKEMLPLCTPKLLFAMANKKWIVNELWAESCLKANAILPEETYETLDPIGGQGCRNSRVSSELLLKNCEIFLLGEFQMISKEDIADLIIDTGGTVVSAPERFSFLPSKLRMIVADRDCLKSNEKQLLDLFHKHSTVILSRDVIIMAIQSHKIPNFSPYYLHPVSEEGLIKLGYPTLLVQHEEEEEEYSSGDTR